MRTLSRRAAALTIIATLTLSACGGSDSGGDTDEKGSSATTSAAPESTVDPATGDAVEGDGYSFNAPEGWTKPEEAIPGTEAADTFVGDLTDDDGFADNINVVRQDSTPPKSFPDYKEELEQQLIDAGIEDVEAKEDGTIDGEESIHISSSQNLAGNKNLTDQYFVAHDDAAFIVTFSWSPDVSEADRDETAASVLATWKWAS